MKIISIIPPDQRQKCRCHFCGTNKSVKYVTEIFDPVLEENKPSRVYCCNMCIMKGNANEN